MSDSIPPNSSSPRPVLKLKTTLRKSSREELTVSPGHSAATLRHPASLRTGPDSSPGVRRQTAHPETSSARPESKMSQKLGAAWSDELKHRMQKDMDALLTR